MYLTYFLIFLISYFSYFFSRPFYKNWSVKNWSINCHTNTEVPFHLTQQQKPQSSSRVTVIDLRFQLIDLMWQIILIKSSFSWIYSIFKFKSLRIGASSFSKTSFEALSMALLTYLGNTSVMQALTDSIKAGWRARKISFIFWENFRK